MIITKTIFRKRRFKNSKQLISKFTWETFPWLPIFYQVWISELDWVFYILPRNQHLFTVPLMYFTYLDKCTDISLTQTNSLIHFWLSPKSPNGSYLWEDMTIALPLLHIHVTVSHIWCLATGSIPVDGSSRKITEDFPIRAIAVFNLRLFPPLYCQRRREKVKEKEEIRLSLIQQN